MKGAIKVELIIIITSLWLEQCSPQQCHVFVSKMGILCHLLKPQSFSNKTRQLKSSAPSERDSYYGHPYLAMEQCSGTGAQSACGWHANPARGSEAHYDLIEGERASFVTMPQLKLVSLKTAFLLAINFFKRVGEHQTLVITMPRLCW